MSELRASEAYRGFVASVPSLSIASNGNQRLSFRFGQEQWTRSEDGEFTQGESLFTDAVMWGDRAERAHDVLRKGHIVVAAGAQRERSFTGREGEDVAVEELEIYRIGPDVTHRYMAVTADRLTKAMLDRFTASAAALRAEATVKRTTSELSPTDGQNAVEGVRYQPPAGQAGARPSTSL
ncbi:single-stranded DNA-binding protein [Ruania zhangjianzhongii]|uniref:single-stranded DNA-binding protein n=1 Tax=Ruania zhangjianzhongii TaxID=2603206 RepID=UPI001651D4F0|nr:single-stranded DNA-binding protein [Ruania zhangjianzhongii]